MTADIIGIGVTCMDHLSISTRTADGWEVLGPPLAQGGGLTATAAVAVARLGASVELWAAIGDDYHGQMCRRELISQGVNVDQLRLVPGFRTGLGFIEVDSVTGERTIYFSANRDRAPSEASLGFDVSMVRGARALLVDAAYPQTAAAAARVAHESGAVVVADLSRLDGPVADLVSVTDGLIVAEWTGEALAGGRDFPLALRRMLDLGPRMPAVTVGPDGCWYWADGGAWHCPAFAIKAVDTTGCGDSFHGAFAYAMHRGWDVHEAIRFSSAVAGLKATKLGGRSGLPTLPEVTRFLEERPEQGRARRA